MNTLQTFAYKIAKSYLYLNDALSSDSKFEQFMLSLGWRLSSIPPSISALSSNLASIQSDLAPIDNNTATDSDYEQLLLDIADTFININGLGSADFSAFTTLPSNFNTIFPKQLNDFLLAYFLHLESPIFFSVLRLLGLITMENTSGTTDRPPYRKVSFNYTNFPLLVSQPIDYLATYYNWYNGLDIYRIYDSIIDLARSIPIIPQDSILNLSAAQKLQEDSTVASSDDLSMLVLIFDLISTGGGLLTTGLGFHMLPAKTGSLPGISITPIVNAGYSTKVHLFDDFYLQIKSNLDLSNKVAAIIRPNEGIKLVSNVDSSSPAVLELEGSVTISLLNESASGAPLTLFGSPDATNLQYKELSVNLGVDISTSGKKDLFAELQLTQAKLHIKLGDGDSFLQTLLPSNGSDIEFEFLIGFSTEKGLYFSGQAGLQVSLPIHKEIFGISFEEIVLSITYNVGSDIKLAASTSFNTKLGALSLNVRQVGVRSNLSFPSGGGNLGPLDFGLHFKPPSGVGIAIDSSTVTGGGFLNYDEATYTYTGGLELKFSKISLSAIGILTTKLPGNSSGYSLLILITAEFTPIQLGMGFTLNGVGGLLGLHRTINTERLKSGVRDKTLDSILFPTDIVKNANAIISNLSQVFPVKKDRFLIGPMAKIGWGTPTLLTLELGIIIELPSPILLAIVGVLKAVLPTEAAPVLKIQINFVGIIDFEKKQLSFDASLYDSSILTFALTGDMALRLYWGDKPNFLLSVGGFHPKFTPPPMNLPQLQRLAIQLASSDNLNVRVETYFAVTSNSVQFGARVAARAHAWKIEAVGALWFDILFQFSPFHFIADMGVMFEIREGGDVLLSLYIDVTLEGPHPWRVQGEGSFKILFVRVHVSFDKTFGQAQTETVAPVAIQSLMHDAIQKKDNWQIVGPDRSHQVVAFRDVTATTGSTLVVDPFGALVFSQKVAPMGLKLAKFGTSAISDVNKFDITGVTVGSGSSAVTMPSKHVTDLFAPNSFFYLTDDQKLSKDSYERFDSGISVGTTSEITTDYYVHKEISYDEIILDSRQRQRFRIFPMTVNEMALHTMDTYVSASGISDTKKKTPFGGPDKLKVEEFDYIIADKNSLSPITGVQSFSSKTDADNYLLSLVGTPSFNDQMVIHAFELH